MTIIERSPTEAREAASPTPHGSTFETLAVSGFIFGLFAIVVAVFALGLAARAVRETGDAVAAGSSGGGPAAAGEATDQINLADFSIDPSDVTVPAGALLQISNDGAIVHNLSVGGMASDMIDAGASTELDLSSLEPGTYEMKCDVPGHAEAGMTGTLTIR